MIRLVRHFLIAVTFCAAAFCFQAGGVRNITEDHWMLPLIGSSKKVTIRINAADHAGVVIPEQKLRSHMICEFRNLTRAKSSDMSRKKRKIKTATTVERLRCKLTSCVHQYLHALRGKGNHRRSA